MTEKLLAIVLNVRKYNDRYNIVTVYSATRGRLVFLSSTGGGKASRLRNARLQPMAVIEGDFRYKPNAEIQHLGAFSLHRVWHDIYFHPVKRLLALFLSEFLNRLILESAADAKIWNFIFNSMVLLDESRSGINDFHIAFLSSLLPFVGIQPDISQYRAGYLFDMESGRFRETVPAHSHFLKGEEAGIVKMVARLNFLNIRRLKLSRSLRLRILEGLINYYDIHFSGIRNIKSLEVLHEIFS